MSTSSGSKISFDTEWEYSPAPESTSHVTIEPQYELFINGEFVAPQDGTYFETINPATETAITKVAAAGDGDVDLAALVEAD